LISALTRPTTGRVDDWEKFFVEKSRRRFLKERQQRRRRLLQILISVAVASAFVAAAVLEFSPLSPEL